MLDNKGWEQCTKEKTYDGFLRQTNSDDAVSIKIIHRGFDKFTPKQVFEGVTDPDFRKEWDPFLISWKIIDKKEPNTDVIRMLLKVPVVTNRDFILDCDYATIGEGENAEYIIRFQTVDHEKYKVEDGYVRGTVGLSGYLIRYEEGKTIVYCIGNSNVGGWIPKWLVNKMSRTAVPDMLNGLLGKLDQHDKF